MNPVGVESLLNAEGYKLIVDWPPSYSVKLVVH